MNMFTREATMLTLCARRRSQDPGTVEARLREYPGLEQLIGGEGTGAGGMGEEDNNTTPTRKVCSQFWQKCYMCTYT